MASTGRPVGRPRVYREDVGVREDAVVEHEVVATAESGSMQSSESEPIEPPTLGDAFRVLCEAMIPHLEEDVPAQMKCETMQSWYQNGPANYATCWRHAILMLEGIVGAPIRV